MYQQWHLSMILSSHLRKLPPNGGNPTIRTHLQVRLCSQLPPYIITAHGALPRVMQAKSSLDTFYEHLQCLFWGLDAEMLILECLLGPNGAPLDNHRPGQVSHPNAIVNPYWKHGLCEPDTLCCMGIVCPCMVYGKTMYRLSRKAQKQDPTDLLGYESCNGSCGLFAVACGFQCSFLLYGKNGLEKLILA